jgi:anti-anti-sigma factor
VSGPAGEASGAGNLRARVCHGAERVTVELSGDLDRLTGPTLIDLVAEIKEHAVARIDIDLADIDFLDLGGLRALLRIHHHSARDGIVVILANPRHYVHWLLEVTGAAEVLLADHRARPARTEPALSWVNRHLAPEAGDTAYALLRERTIEADDRDRFADEREHMLDERQQRLTDHQQWEDIRESLADQRERDLERRECDD